MMCPPALWGIGSLIISISSAAEIEEGIFKNTKEIGIKGISDLPQDIRVELGVGLQR